MDHQIVMGATRIVDVAKEMFQGTYIAVVVSRPGLRPTVTTTYFDAMYFFRRKSPGFNGRSMQPRPMIADPSNTEAMLRVVGSDSHAKSLNIDLVDMPLLNPLSTFAIAKRGKLEIMCGPHTMKIVDFHLLEATQGTSGAASQPLLDLEVAEQAPTLNGCDLPSGTTYSEQARESPSSRHRQTVRGAQRIAQQVRDMFRGKHVTIFVVHPKQGLEIHATHLDDIGITPTEEFLPDDCTSVASTRDGRESVVSTMRVTGMSFDGKSVQFDSFDMPLPEPEQTFGRTTGSNLVITSGQWSIFMIDTAQMLWDHAVAAGGQSP